jgi:hypothetical protein
MAACANLNTDYDTNAYARTLLALAIDGTVSNAVKDEAMEKALR